MPEPAQPALSRRTFRAGIVRRLTSRRVEVQDGSMEPTLRPGDRLLVEPATDPKVGDLVVVRDPTRSGRWLVKRVGARAGQRIFVTRLGMEWVREEGEPAPPGDSIELLVVPDRTVFLVSDRPEGASDSRRFGPVPLRLVVGRAWFRYFPRERRQEL